MIEEFIILNQSYPLLGLVFCPVLALSFLWYRFKILFLLCVIFGFLSSSWVRYPFFGLVVYLDIIALFCLCICVLKKNYFKKIGITASIVCLIIYISPLPRLLIYSLECHLRNKPIQEDIDGLILLGGMFSRIENPDFGEKVVFNKAVSRLLEFLRLVQKHPKSFIFFSGSYGEALYVKKMFFEFGISHDRLIIDAESKNTRENVNNIVRYIMYNKLHNKKWLLVTSAYHMPRSYSLVSDKGFSVMPYCVDYQVLNLDRSKMMRSFFDRQNSYHWRTVMKEYAGLIDNFLLGLSKNLLPKY